MKKIIRDVDEKRGIVQVTIADERWYLKERKNAESGIPEIIGVPSVTWIAGSYPKGIQFYKWLADKGWDEAEAIKSAAGDKGSKIHAAVSAILAGEEVRIDSKFVNPSTGQEEELTLEECDAILSFVLWRNETKPKSLLWDKAVFSDKHNAAGSLDYVYSLEGDEPNTIHLPDFKSGQYIWTEYELQVSAYKHFLIENLLKGEIVIPGLDLEKPINVVLEILQLGYRRNKANWKLTIVEDRFSLFLTAKEIWAHEHGEEVPKKKDYPLVLSPALTAVEAMGDTERKPIKKPKNK